MDNNFKDGDVFVNKYNGDIWVLEENKLIRINSGDSLTLENISSFKKIGHIDKLEDMDTSFYVKLDPCPLCKSTSVICIQDSSNLFWKIGCTTRECPCCVHHLVGKYQRKETAVMRWNM